MEQSPDLYEIMARWDDQLREERKEKLRALLDSRLILFFNKDGEYYGCPEEARLIFAKLKTPDEDVTPSWEEEAAFIGLNLSRALEDDEPPKRIFYKKDLKGIKIIDRDELEKLLFTKKKT